MEVVRALMVGVVAGWVLGGGFGIVWGQAGCATFGPAAAWGTVSIGSLKEASGLASSWRNPGVLWTHNDGSSQDLFAIGTNGARLATFDLNKSVDDTEDMAVGPGPVPGVSYLYLGDIGGSQGTNTVRHEVKIVRAPEPLVDPAWAAKPHSSNLEGVETFTLVYPDGSYDAESLMVDPISGDLFIVTKQELMARVYRASLVDLTDKGTRTLELVRAVDFTLASAGDISRDGARIVLRREDFARLWQRQGGEPIGDALARAGQSIPVVGPPKEPNGEGLALLADGTGYATISEGENPVLYFFASLCPAAPRLTLSLTNVSVFAGGTARFQGFAVGYPAPAFFWTFNGSPLSGQAGAALILSNLTLADAGVYGMVASNASGMATNTAALEVRPKPDLRITEVMSAPAAGIGVATADWWELTSFESQTVNLTGWRFNDGDGGLADAFGFADTLTIQPGESVVFVEDLTPAKFRKWWGASNVPPETQIVDYKGGGLGLGPDGDSLRLWNDTTTDIEDTIARASFGAATAGVSFNYDPATGGFGDLSRLGVNGVLRAASTADIGSPGRVVAPIVAPSMRVGLSAGRIRLEFDAAVGRRYFLESRHDLEAGTWDPTGDTFDATQDGSAFFEKAVATNQRFYRVKGE